MPVLFSVLSSRWEGIVILRNMRVGLEDTVAKGKKEYELDVSTNRTLVSVPLFTLRMRKSLEKT